MAKKHSLEVVLCLSFLLACLFSFVFFGAGWSVIFAAIGGILGVLMPKQMGNISRKIFAFINKQEKVTKLVLAAVVLILSIFLPPLIFLVLGKNGGQKLVQDGSRMNPGHEG